MAKRLNLAAKFASFSSIPQRPMTQRPKQPMVFEPDAAAWDQLLANLVFQPLG
jgi:hypothetical protein